MLNCIDIIDNKNCYGCSACYSACPTGCILMSPDDEGFYYPNVDSTQCSGCGLCRKACPMINNKAEIPFDQTAFIVQHTNSKVLLESTSGGAFSAIAEAVIGKGGVVFGATLDEDLTVRHGYVNTVEDLTKFRNSKYVESEICDTFSQTLDFLRQGRYVCFSGTPCQIEGLHCFLATQSHELQCHKLVTVDFVCRAVPSNIIYKKYLELHSAFAENKYTSTEKHKIEIVRFRDKSKYGYKYSQMAHYNRSNELIYNSGVESNYMMRAFFSNICDRPSCYDCKFKKRYRVSDFTIWDCFNPGVYNKSFDNDRGVTSVLIHTEKARQLFTEVTSLRTYEVSPDELCAAAMEMTHSVPMNPRRDAFFADSRKMDSRNFFLKYFPDTARVKIERIGRRVCLRLGIYRPILRLVQKIGLGGRG